MPSVDISPAVARCENCGAEIPADADHCPACDRSLTSRPARLTVTVTLILIFAGFAGTQYLVNAHRATEEMLAQRWFTRGNEAMQAKLPAVAADCFRTALNYDRENRQYRLRLAEALLAANRLTEAHAHLISLWEIEPANGEVNLALARLNVRRNNPSEAIRYYDNAINGVWDEEPRKQRIATRFELVQYLMQRNDLARAQAELLALQADAPTDTESRLHLAQLLLEAKEPTRAVEVYNTVLDDDRGNAQAYLGKGLAMLQLGDYIGAESALSNAVERAPKSAEAREQLDLVREVLRLDPSLRKLSMADRTRRVADAFHIAWQRLTGCAAQHGYNLATTNAASSSTANQTSGDQSIPAPGDLQLLYSSGLQKQAAATEGALRGNPDALEPTMQYVFEVERTTASICPNMDTANRALLLLAQHESEAPK